MPSRCASDSCAFEACEYLYDSARPSLSRTPPRSTLISFRGLVAQSLLLVPAGCLDRWEMNSLRLKSSSRNNFSVDQRRWTPRKRHVATLPRDLPDLPAESALVLSV